MDLKQLKGKPFITTNLCIKIVQCIKQNSAPIRITPGTTLSNTKGKVVYTPPSGEKIIRDKLSKWEKFINAESNIDPLIKMALMHYQFEAIHPFSDGNGRTGRILLLLYLKVSGLLHTPAIYLSEYIINNKAAYYRSLKSVTEKSSWENFILYMLDMIEVTALNGLERLNKITAAMEKMTYDLKKQLPKIYSKDLIEVLFRLPYTKRHYLIEKHLGNAKTVGNYLISLEEKGFLESVKGGQGKVIPEQAFIKYTGTQIIE